MTLTVTDEPPDRPEWMSETIRLVGQTTGAWRDELLARVARASERDLVAGTDDDWGLGQVAVHLLLIDRGVAGIALRLAKGEPSGPTGQPRPAAARATREGIAALAAKAREAMSALAAGFPARPDLAARARHPYYGDLNAFGWLLTLPNHYRAHLDALDRGTRSAL
ncbi:MAG TPA: DinB family protein [Candidatus Limnocylindria bacterium]|nr:DinB family protein [Candidatus Limnocylindria bacterium]